MKKNEICAKCVSDTTMSDIVFNEKGVCNFCVLQEDLEKKYPLGAEGEKNIQLIIQEIKKRGYKKKYDCIVGVSGGVDSTYCVLLAKKWGLRILAVHLDNGWNSLEAEHNIKTLVEKLGIDLKVVKVNKEEFKKLQIAFLKASVSEIEIPTDVGIYSTLYKVAAQEDIPSIINGHSIRQEGTQPLSWTYMDGKYIDSVYEKFTGEKLKYFNNLKISNMIYYMLVKRIKEYRPLEFLDYDKQEAGKILEKETDWKDYGGHHFESIYTRFVASYIMPTKFDIDKRKVSLSAKVRSGKLKRDEALAVLNGEYYPVEKIKKDQDFVLTRLGLSNKEFDEIMGSPIKTHKDYKTYLTTIKKFKFFIKIACKLKLLPIVFYEKYAK
ncbi:MAG: N-acetyl sugar amidotransferase [Candidatus Cloacimonetes bacterium]|nr:N-acetyl sugar amidotransferase [Candidatus Cloacimonadota bacterium]